LKIRLRKKIFGLLKAVLILLLATGGRTGLAETWKGKDLRWQMEQARWKFGPLWIRPVIVLTNVGYDTNVYGTSYNQVKDYTLTAGPGFTVYLPLKKKVVFKFYESPQYVYFFETRRERTWNNYLNGEVNFALNKIFITAGMGYSQARERWNTEIDIRPRRKEASLQASALWQMTKKSSFAVGFRRARYEYENLYYEWFNVRDQLNREENCVNGTAYYQLSSRTRFFVDGEYGFFNFMNPSNFRDSKSYGLYGGFEFSPFGKVRGRVKLGYKFFDSIAPNRKDYKGLVGDTNVSVRLLRVLSVRGSYRRDVQFSLWYDNTYFLENRAGGGASLYFLKKFRLDYDYGLGRNIYPGGQSPSGDSPSLKRRDDYTIHSMGLYFRLKKNIGLGLIASRWRRDSNLEWEDDTRDFLGLNLTYDF
jgi:hypothetical protein